MRYQSLNRLCLEIFHLWVFFNPERQPGGGPKADLKMSTNSPVKALREDPVSLCAPSPGWASCIQTCMSRIIHS
jgi:hypothetical protein